MQRIFKMIKFVNFLQERKINVKGVLHIGAHTAEEEPEYLKLVSGKDKIIWVEANPVLAEKLQYDPSREVVCALITDKDNEERDFIITNHDQSNSIFELEEHKNIFPWVFQTGKVKMKTSTIDTLFYEKVVEKGINMLAMDIQGAELLALKGANKCLHHFDVIYTEVNLTHVYKDCALITELDSFLEEYGFYRAESLIHGDAWGDAIYLKKTLEMSIQEGEDLDRVWNMLKHNVSVLVDVGAKDSTYPSSCSSSSHTEHHLFDPNLEHYTKLYKQYENNPNVYISNIALGDKFQTVTYYPGSESINPRFFGKEKITTVRQDTLDNYCEKMGIERINFLKIDTEGHELSVLKGASKILNFTDAVLFEYGGTYPDAKITLAEVYNLLNEKGFKYIYYIGKNCLLYQPKPVEHCKYSNYLALRTTWKEALSPIPKIGICCINLEKSFDRKRLMIPQLNKLGFPYNIFKGVDGKKIDVNEDENIAYYKNLQFKYKCMYWRKLSYGEIGCFISQISACKSMLKTENDYFLMLEDDNIILDINMARQQLINIPKIDFEMCFMSASMNTDTVKGEKINDYFYRTSKRFFNRANAILFSRKGLEKLVSAYEEKGIYLPYDDFIADQNLNIITVNKLLFRCNEETFSSNIWSIYKNGEQFAEIKHDKPSYQGKLSMGLNGWARMGNCMFQYAFLKALSLEKTMEIVLPDKCKELIPFSNIEYDMGEIKDLIQLTETKFEYDPEIIDKISYDKNYIFSGYFQSYKYFEKYKDIIIDLFRLDLKNTKRIYTTLSGGRKLCGVHIRLPDTRGETGFIYNQPSNKFICEAIEKINEKEPETRFIVCSSDIQECIRLYKDFFPQDTIFSKMGKYEDFALLSLCDNNIITSGSFGWWASYLNKTPNKMVVCMSPNFNPSVKIANESDYYPKEWIIIQN